MKDFDPSKEHVYLHYFDANNLYGWAMCKPLPTGGFSWVCDSTLDSLRFNMVNLSESEVTGMILEVDFHNYGYPQHLHYLHDDFPCAPEKMSIKYKDLSEWQKELAQTKKDSEEKPVPILFSRKNYVLHWKNSFSIQVLGSKSQQSTKPFTFGGVAFSNLTLSSTHNSACRRRMLSRKTSSK